MAIGKPLRIQERLGVQQPVLSERFRAKELSTNVPVQKIPFADYSIGMNNAKASFAVSDELINMVDAGVKAKVYHDNAVKDRKRLNLMEDWQNSDMQYQQDFAKAKTFEEQQDVISSYDAMQDQLTASWKQEMGDDLQSAKYLSSLRTGSRKQYSKFSTTSYQTLHKDTVSLHKTNMERTAQDLAKNKNSDYTSGVKSLQDSVTSLVGLGEFSAEEAALNLQTTTDKILTERSTLFAHDYAQNILNTGQDFPTEEELDIHMSNVTGIMLSPSKLALSREAFSDSFYKEMGEFNRAEKVEQAFTKKALLAKMTTFEQETAEYLLGLEGGVPSKEYTAQRVEKAKAFDTSWNPGYSKKVESDLNKMRWGTASPTQVEFFTEGDGRQLFPEAYHDLKAVEQRLRGMGDVGEKTILGIVQKFRTENDGISKELGNASKKTVDNVLNALRSDPSVFQPDQMVNNAWDKFGSIGMTMEKVFAQSLPLGLAYRKVQARLEADRTANPPRGAFSDATMKLPVGQQLEELNKVAEAYIREEFGGILVKKQEEEEKRIYNEKTKDIQGEGEFNRKVDDRAELNKLKDRMSKEIVGVKDYERMQKSRLPKVQQRSPAEIRAERNEKLKSDFKTKMSKGDNLGAIGTALSRPLSDAVDKFNEMHEESKKTYAKQPTNLNDRKAAIKDMATASKNIKESMIGEAATNFAKAAGKDWDIAKDDVADTLSEMTNWLGSRLLHGLENDTIEKTPPPKPPESTVPPEVSQATPMQSTVGNPDMVQQVAQALAPVADVVFGGSPASAEPIKFTELPEETQSLTEDFKYVSKEDAVKSIQRNNAFNIEESKIDWQGQVKSDSDRFMATDTPLNGLRAGWINMLAKFARGETLAQTIETLSPKSDNNPTEAMVQVASEMADMAPDDTLEISMDNFDKIKKLGLGLLRFEAPGHNYPDSLIDEAVKLAIEQKSGKSKKVLNYPPPKNFKQEKELKPIVEKKGNFFDSIGDAMRSGLTEAIPDNIRFFASYLHDEYRGLQGRGTQKPTITENELSTGVQSVLKTAALKARSEGRDYVTYTDYPDSGVGLSIPAIVASKGAKNKEEYAQAKKRYPKGWRGKARLVMDSTDDAIAAATTIGQFRFKIENGELILTDTYDFSKYGGAKNSAYAEVRKSVESGKGGVAYKIKANLGQVV